MQTTEDKVQFAICIFAEAEGDLEIWKVYQVLPNSQEQQLGCLRVVDESGEDYLYPADWFVLVDFPQEVQAKLLAVVDVG
jgi:hypothetical protein